MSQFEKTYRQKEGQTNGKTDGRMDRLTLFHRTLPAKVGGPKRTKNASDLLSVCLWPDQISPNIKTEKKIKC